MQIDGQPRASRYRYMQSARRAALDKIKAAMKETGFSASKLATKAGLAHTTFKRFLNDPENYPSIPSTKTLHKLEEYLEHFRRHGETSMPRPVKSREIPEAQRPKMDEDLLYDIVRQVCGTFTDATPEEAAAAAKAVSQIYSQAIAEPSTSRDGFVRGALSAMKARN